ncbi:MAG: hypothetical protein ABI217_11480 [Chthoniobacterales bacterium]
MTVHQMPTATTPLEFNLADFRCSDNGLQPTAPEGTDNVSPQRKIKGEFVKAIPLKWLEPAIAVGGRTLATALAIWFEHGRKKANTINLTTAVLRRFSVNRKAGYRALKQLERAGSIKVRRAQGKNPIVTLIVGADFRGSVNGSCPDGGSL